MDLRHRRFTLCRSRKQYFCVPLKHLNLDRKGTSLTFLWEAFWVTLCRRTDSRFLQRPPSCLKAGLHTHWWCLHSTLYVWYPVAETPTNVNQQNSFCLSFASRVDHFLILSFCDMVLNKSQDESSPCWTRTQVEVAEIRRGVARLAEQALTFLEAEASVVRQAACSGADAEAVATLEALLTAVPGATRIPAEPNCRNRLSQQNSKFSSSSTSCTMIEQRQQNDPWFLGSRQTQHFSSADQTHPFCMCQSCPGSGTWGRTCTVRGCSRHKTTSRFLPPKSCTGG